MTGGPPTRTLTFQDLRQLDRRFGPVLNDLMEWSTFSLERFVHVVEEQRRGTIHLVPFHWSNAALTGLTIGWSTRGGPQWLVLYESETSDDHQLLIVLHELMHILFRHCSAHLRPEQVGAELAAQGIDLSVLLPGTSSPPLIYERSALHPTDLAPPSLFFTQEQEAELAATWVITHARRAGALPPSGLAFTNEHRLLDTLLRPGTEH